MTDREDRQAEHEHQMLWEQISDLEHRGWRALCGGDAGGFYRDLMAPGGMMVLIGGTVMDRDTVQETLREAPPWAAFEIDEEKLITPAADVAQLVYRGTGHRDDGTKIVARMSSTYVRDESRDVPWRLSLYTQTAVEG